MTPTLTPTELARIAHALSCGYEWRQVQYPGGSRVARAGHTVLFASGGKQSFDSLWRQARSYAGPGNPAPIFRMKGEE